MSFDLNKREYGGWFAPLERDFIFLKNQEHIGWVVYDSDISFKLKLTPFFEQYRECLYLVPEGMPMPKQNECIEIKPLQIIKKPIFNDKSTIGKYQNFCIIDSYKEYKFNIQDYKPDIDYKTFKYECSINWIDAEEDDLDVMLALEAISCPSSVYGKGGIGTMAAKTNTDGKLSKSIIPNLSSTYSTILANNFRALNDNYYFNLIKTKSDTDDINILRQTNSCEINYCKPCLTEKDALAVGESIPIQIPMLIRNAKHKTAELAEPYLLLQYQITALMHSPQFETGNATLTKIENNIKNMLEARHYDNILSVDPNSVNKLATAFSRLGLHNEVQKKEINDAIDLLFVQINDWKPYIKESVNTKKFRETDHQIDMLYKYSRDHQKFMVELQKLHDETNEKWVSIADMKNKFASEKRHLVIDLAIELNYMGRILQDFNFSKIRKVVDF